MEFRYKVQDSILGNHLLGPIDENLSIREKTNALREVSIWGVPLLPSKAHEGTDAVLYKFLKARDFSVDDAFDMLQKTVMWRKENNIDSILEEEFDCEYDNSVCVNGRDRGGRPVCYMVYGVFGNKEMYKKAFGSEKERGRYLRWRIQFMERTLRKLCFREGGVDSVVQIVDLNGTPKYVMREVNLISKKTLALFQNYYPETIYKEVGSTWYHKKVLLVFFVYFVQS